MEPYACTYLQFLASAAGTAGPTGPAGRVENEAFVFATRLTVTLGAARSKQATPIALRRAAGAVAGLVQRHPDRRRAAARSTTVHGRRGMARGCGRRDPLRRLGAR